MSDSTAFAARLGRRAWGWVLVDGILGIVIGILALLLPGITVLTLSFLLGLTLLVQGGLEVYAGLGAHRGTPGRGWTLVLGVLSVVAGLIVLFEPGTGIFAILLGVAIWFIAAGVNQLVAAFTLAEDRVFNLVLGAISVVAGLVLFLNPSIGIGALAILAGWLFILRGVAETAFAVRLRRGAMT